MIKRTPPPPEEKKQTDVAKEETLEPVLDEKGEPAWLTRRYEKHSVGEPRSSKEILKEDCMLMEIPVFNLKKQGIWQCKKCGAEMQSLDGAPAICSYIS